MEEEVFYEKSAIILERKCEPKRGSSKQVSCLRLSKIMGRGLIQRSFVPIRDRAASCYSLTQKGFGIAKMVIPYELAGNSTQSDSPLHDVELVNIRRCLESRECITEYFTENLLQTAEEFRENSKFRSFIQLNSDGFMRVKKTVEGKEKKFKVAVEYEGSRKSLQRYKKKLRDYYSEYEVSGVFYICSEPTILKTILKADDEVCKKDEEKGTKVFATLLKEVHSEAEKIIFKGACHGSFSL